MVKYLVCLPHHVADLLEIALQAGTALDMALCYEHENKPCRVKMNTHKTVDVYWSNGTHVTVPINMVKWV